MTDETVVVTTETVVRVVKESVEKASDNTYGFLYFLIFFIVLVFIGVMVGSYS